MVSTGLRLVIGSWKIIEILSPRTLRISSSGSAKRSRPSRRITPSTRLFAAGRSRMTESAVTLLPEPDSPTMATVWRAPTSKDKAFDRRAPDIVDTEGDREVANGENGLRSGNGHGPDYCLGARRWLPRLRGSRVPRVMPGEVSEASRGKGTQDR